MHNIIVAASRQNRHGGKHPTLQDKNIAILWLEFREGDGRSLTFKKNQIEV